MKKPLINIGIALAIFIIGVLALNAPYFIKQIKFRWHKPSAPMAQNQFAEPKTGPPNFLEIPSLQISAPIQFADDTNENKFQEALRQGVVHYPNTANIGEVGNPYIFGHSSDFAFSKGNYKTVFALLPNIEIGAEILATNKDGTQFSYKVFNKFVAKKTDVYLLDQQTGGKKLLTLQTSYPIGTALQRYIVLAELQE
jgi:LPXTG-site transpeptidase (sortase) family protein